MWILILFSHEVVVHLHSSSSMRAHHGDEEAAYATISTLYYETKLEIHVEMKPRLE